MRIEMRCRCGTVMVVEDDAKTTINSDRSPDANGDVYVSQRIARAFATEHALCATAPQYFPLKKDDHA
jgi:hypothetical protein